MTIFLKLYEMTASQVYETKPYTLNCPTPDGEVVFVYALTLNSPRVSGVCCKPCHGFVRIPRHLFYRPIPLQKQHGSRMLWLIYLLGVNCHE